MNRPPYPARVVAGLLVTTVEETRKLPTRVITFPLTAVSSGVQAAMRLQQNIAELAIKGDEVLAPLFDKAEAQPEWARFDEDEEPASEPVEELAPAKKPVVKKSQAKKAADTEAATKAADSKAAEPEAAEKSAADAPAAGRFALYTAPPADVTAAAATKVATTDESAPDIVRSLDYDALTLAQLRAKVRTLDVADLRQLAEYERGARNRAPFVTMIDNRIASHDKKAESGQ